MPACPRCGEPNRDEATFCGRCGARILSAPLATTARKVVTVLFSDVSGFTALGERLDPESLQQLMGRWFHETQRIIKRHDGTVEKYMGDAVMAVFGVPVVHEDDAIRAARAALEMHETLVDLNDELAQRWGVRLEIHTGLNTGEVVVGSAPGGDLSTVGDVVNVAQRLEASAPPGEVLIGSETARLLGGTAELDPIDPLSVKGKTLPVSASRLVSVGSELSEVPTRATPPFVGRELELERLITAFAEVSASRQPRLVTVLGPAGIGKSRLVRALLREIREEATAVVGRCLPYGDGITYWPVAEIVRALSGAPTEAAVAALAGGGASSEESELVATRISRAAGFTSGTVSVEEAQWAVRKLMEHIARERALVVVIEDIHWAEPSLLDLLEHVAALSADVPLLLVCIARPDLLEERPSWPKIARERAATVTLDPLSPTKAEELLDRLTGGGELAKGERDRFLTAAEGNPFFLQQMVAMRTEARGEGIATIPPTIQAVLTARIDRLPHAERTAIERASVEGRTFHRGAIAELLPQRERADLDASLDAIVGRGLIRPARPEFANERAYAFDHILIRDATYSLIPKRLRADLHERHAAWLEHRSDQELGEHEELAGYHLERAYRYRVELEPGAPDRHRQLAMNGADHLGTAGRAALARDDTPAAIKLLERAVALLPEDAAERGALMPELGTALTEAGRLPEAEGILEAAVGEAASRGDARAEAHATVARLFVLLQVDTEAGTRELRERFDSLLATFEAAGDDLGLGRLWRLRGLVHWIEARSASADGAWERAAEHSRLAADERGWSESLSWLASSARIGPTPVEDAIARCATIREQLSGHRRELALVLDHVAALRAMRGEFGNARRLLAESKAIMAELGTTIHTAVSHDEAFVAYVSGDLAGAEAVLRAGYERLAEMGEKALLATTAAMLAEVIYEQGRMDDAWAFTQASESAAAADDVSAQIAWRAVRAQLLARRGDLAEAKRLSSEAVSMAAGTDWLTYEGDALMSRAHVLQMAGEGRGATEAFEMAVTLYAKKGNTVAVQHAHSVFGDSVPV